MIIKRKPAPLQNKSKQKIKTIKQGPKTKRQGNNEKMQPCASKKHIKSVNQVREHSETHRYANENENISNLPSMELAAQHRGKLTFNQERQHQAPSSQIKRSASAGVIKVSKQIARKSLSPTCVKESKQKVELKQKYYSRPSSKSEKEKAKNQSNHDKNKVKPAKKSQAPNCKVLNRKQSEKFIKPATTRVKTESSNNYAQEKHAKDKTNKTKPPQKSKLSTKNVSAKQKPKSTKLKQKIKNSIIFSQISSQNSPLYSAIMTKQNFIAKLDKQMSKTQENRVVSACITIQRHFRGYLTRKYIEELKYELYSVIKIQKVWRGYLCRKRLRKDGSFRKNLSIENSLITIKNFSDDKREQRLKKKSFKFDCIENSSNKNQQESASKQSSTKKEDKYALVLETLLQEEGLDEKYKEKIRNLLGKEHSASKVNYVQNKIISEIISEKSFNSPRSARTPKVSFSITSPSSWSKLKAAEAAIEPSHCSPVKNNEISEVVFKRITSPASKEATNSVKKVNSKSKGDEDNTLRPFGTTFPFIEEFQLKIVDFLRDYTDYKDVFLLICKQSQNFQSKVTLLQWNRIKNSAQWDQSYLESATAQPNYFPESIRQQIMQESSMKIYLEDNNYEKQTWADNNLQKQVCQGFIQCIYDGLSEAIYQNYRNEVIMRFPKNTICYLQGHKLFTHLLMNTLTLMQSWCEYSCGVEIPVDENDPNFKLYSQKNSERLEAMVKGELEVAEPTQNCWRMWLKFTIAESIFQEIASELTKQMLI